MPFLFPLLLLLQTGDWVTVTDDLNRVVAFPSPPQRIVSLAPSITETLFALGAGDQVAGVTAWCNFPAEAARKPRVGGMINPDMETIIGLRPDLVVLSVEGNIRDDLDRIIGAGIPVLVTNPRTLEGIHRSILTLGTVTGWRRQADSLVQAMRAGEGRIIAAARAGRERDVLLVVSLQPLLVVGHGTFLAQLLSLAGGKNLAAASLSTYPQFSREAVVAGDPEVLFIMSDILGEGESPTSLYPEWEHLRAVRTGRVHRVDADLLARPGPRAVEALTLLHTLMYQDGR